MAQASTSSAPVNLPEESTLDESIFKTIWRDLVTILRNLRSVLIPINWNFNNRDAALRNWDLWGPLIFLLLLSSVLSIGESEKQTSKIFALVFAECALGSLVLTANAILLGGEIVFFQAVCLMGYCLFPICISAIVCATVGNKIIRTVALALGVAWSSVATIPFIGKAVPQGRKALAIYPVCLLYASLGWFGLVKAR